MSRYLTVEEVAETLSVSVSWVYKHKQLLDGVQLGPRMWRFPSRPSRRSLPPVGPESRSGDGEGAPAAFPPPPTRRLLPAAPRTPPIALGCCVSCGLVTVCIGFHAPRLGEPQVLFGQRAGRHQFGDVRVDHHRDHGLACPRRLATAMGGTRRAMSQVAWVCRRS